MYTFSKLKCVFQENELDENNGILLGIFSDDAELLKAEKRLKKNGVDYYIAEYVPDCLDIEPTLDLQP